MRTHHILFALLAFSLIAPAALAHAIGGRDAAFVQATIGADPFPFLYLGAKHMVTGYDHLLFLLGVIFFLYRLRDILLYVTLFSLGHSTTLILGVLFDLGVSSHLVDMVIGLSVCWKAFENLGGFLAIPVGQLQRFLDRPLLDIVKRLPDQGGISHGGHA